MSVGDIAGFCHHDYGLVDVDRVVALVRLARLNRVRDDLSVAAQAQVVVGARTACDPFADYQRVALVADVVQ